MTAACPSHPSSRPGSLVRWRRLVQVAALLGFLVAVIAAARGYRIAGTLELVFLLDPLVTLIALLAGSFTVALLVWSGISVLGALILGRSFCGWLCPLGTMLDCTRHLMPRILRRDRRAWRSGPLVVLIAVVIAALASMPLLGWVEPFAVVVRAITAAVLPAWDAMVQTVSGWWAPAIDHVPGPGLMVDDYRFIGAPVRQSAPGIALAGLSIALLTVVLLGELLMARAWCRLLCPTGALLGLLSRWSLVRRLPIKTCGSCRICVQTCHLGAFDARGVLIPSACTACLRCVDDCPQELAVMAVDLRPRPPAILDVSRRGFLAAMAIGTAAPLVGSATAGLQDDPHRIRPPGVAGGDDYRFLNACVRCGACMTVCPTRALQPTWLADGLAGIQAPRLVPRIGACERDCTACGEVCPTGAIPLLDLRDKPQRPMGLAIHDHHRCLPWSGSGECRVCWEHCPAQGKAITLHLAHAPNGQALPMPAVDASRCTGCGTCEFVCPIEGEAGIRVVTMGSVARMTAELQPQSVRS